MAGFEEGTGSRGVHIPKRRQGADGVLYGANINPDNYEKGSSFKQLFNKESTVTIKGKKWPITPDITYRLWDDNIGFNGQFAKMDKKAATQQLIAKKRKDGNWDIFRLIHIKENWRQLIWSKTYCDLQKENLSREEAVQTLNEFDLSRDKLIKRSKGNDIKNFAK